MAIQPRVAGTQRGSPTSGSPITLPLTTLAYDCIVYVTGCGGASNAVTMSGAGATWTEAIYVTTAPTLVCYIGYGCAGGDTTITPTYSGGSGSTEATYVIGMFTGVRYSSSPVTSTTTGSWSTSLTTITTSTQSYTVGDLVISVIGMFSTGTTTWSATTWSNTESTTSMGANTGGDTYQTAADFVIASSSSSTTATYIWSTSKVANIGIMRLSLSGPTQTEQIVTVV